MTSATPTPGNSSIQVEITDASEFHCFRLLLNPQGHAPDCERGTEPNQPCTCAAQGAGVRIEIMLHARSLVDLIHKCSEALCEWQHQTTGYLLERAGVKKEIDPL
jgi:hypothetical protein